MSVSRIHQFLFLLGVGYLCCYGVRANQTSNLQQQISDILETTGIKGGLIIHVGCGDGKLTAALRVNDSFIVHGLDADVAAARQYIQSLGLYGPVSAERWTGQRLPYADNLVNLIVAEKPGDLSMDEVMRVLAPNGVALIAGKKTVKPHPTDTDEWTHFLHDATGNSVSHDREVGPPRRVQWIETPPSTRSHEHTPSVASVVSSAGRIFYIVDEAPVSSILEPPQWHIVARDAYNGILLWKRPVAEWWPHICNWTSGPRQLQRRLVAIGDRVYVALGLHAPLSILDAATGKTLRVCDQTAGTEEIIWHNGTLLLAIRKVTGERTAQLAKWTKLSTQKDSPLYDRDTAAPLLKLLRATEDKAETSVMALDAATGRELWMKTGADTDKLAPLTLSAMGAKVFYQTTNHIACVDLATGRKLWQASASGMRVVSERGVICVNKGTVSALSPETGAELWSQDSLLCEIKDAFVINDTLWLGGFKPWQGKKSGKGGPAWGPYFATQCDLATGKLLKQIEPENPGHHHRCYLNKATDRYILGGRRGTEFIDLQNSEVLWNSWARGVCMYGIMPANGLLYVPPHACGCYVATKLNGFFALASAAGTKPDHWPVSAECLERGQAFSEISNMKSQISDSDWPAFRHDAARSGTTIATVPTNLKQLWQSAIGGQLTAPTIAGGNVYVASVDEHRVCVLDAGSGAPKWNFTAAARVDSPPTLCSDAAIFGSRDGCVYNLRTSDGALVWRSLAARDDRRIVAHGQLESVSPVHGSVLVENGVAFVTAGRSSYLDGGIDLCRFDMTTGKLLSRTPIYSPDPKTDKQPPHEGPGNMPGVLDDILTSDSGHVYLRESVFGKDGHPQSEGKPHLLTLTGFLDDSWPHRSDWIFGTHCSLPTGCTKREPDVICGRLMVFNDAKIYGYGRQGVQWSNQLKDGPYRIFAVNRGDGASQWSKSVPIQVRAMLLAGEVLFIAGPPAKDDNSSPLLLAVSSKDGAELARCPLNAAPVFDGLAAAGGRLYVATMDGNVHCLVERK